MQSVSVSVAHTHFNQLIDMVQTGGPVRIQRQGRDVAIVMSPEEFRRLAAAARGKVNPAVEHLHAESAARWGSVYEALAR